MEDTRPRRFGWRRQYKGKVCLCMRSLFALSFLLLLTLGPLALGADTGQPKNVLILHSFPKAYVFDALESLESTVRSSVSVPVNFYVERMETQHFGSRDYKTGQSVVLRGAYAKEKLDLVIVFAYPALQFAAEYRDRMFPGVPIVFVMVAPGRIQGHKLWPGITGVTIPMDVRGTLDLAVRLHPGTKHVAVIAGNSEYESYWLDQTHQELRRRADELKVIDLVGLPTGQLLEQVSTLPPRTVVFFELLPQDSSYPVISGYDVLAAIAQRFPTYCINNYCFDHGAIGGSYPDPDEQAVKGGKLAARVLSGEKPENIPVVHGSRVHVHVDWRQLRRWNISESALPPGAIVLHRQPTVWKSYKKYILTGVAVIICQALLIAGLLWQRARSRKTDLALRESEKRFRVMADSTPALIWMCDKEGNVTYINDRRISFTGRDPKSGFGDTWTAYIHPDDLQSVQTANARALETCQSYSKEYRLRRRDSEYRWMLDVASPRKDETGTFAGFIGAAIDVTDQKLAQESLATVSGKLIEAQEAERRRIAGELHDDICQRLAMLTLELEQASQGPSFSADRLGEITEGYGEIALDVQALSHELHSSKLEYLGLVAGLRGFCEEFSEQQSVDIEFTHEEVPAQLPDAVSLCIFRIAQEALHNAVKHSGKREFTVRLLGSRGEIELEVSDTGAGFDVEAAKASRGLGLVSMRERVQALKGSLAIESSPQGGTKVSARVPTGTVIAQDAKADRVERMTQEVI